MVDMVDIVAKEDDGADLINPREGIGQMPADVEVDIADVEVPTLALLASRLSKVVDRDIVLQLADCLHSSKEKTEPVNSVTA